MGPDSFGLQEGCDGAPCASASLAAVTELLGRNHSRHSAIAWIRSWRPIHRAARLFQSVASGFLRAHTRAGQQACRRPRSEETADAAFESHAGEIRTSSAMVSDAYASGSDGGRSTHASRASLPAPDCSLAAAHAPRRLSRRRSVDAARCGHLACRLKRAPGRCAVPGSKRPHPRPRALFVWAPLSCPLSLSTGVIRQ